MFNFKHQGQGSAFATFAILIVGLVIISLSAPLAMAASDAALNPLAVEGPVAGEFAVRSAQQLATFATVPLDIAAARAEDETRDERGLPPRFAIPESTWLTPEDSGVWEDLDDRYQIWRARISAPGALSLNLGFTGYRLPKGARLSIYPTDVTGPEDYRGLPTFTNRDNDDHGQLWTPVILADDIVLELVLPRSERHNYRLELTAINKGYRYFGEDLTALGYDKAGACNVDVVCPEGDDWRAEINSVGVISTGGSTFCTGVMMNNTAEDGTPYFLTANHCGISASVAPSLVVYWNFQSPVCGDQSGGLLNQFMTGATHLASATASDFSLVLMDDPVDPAHEVSFAGWDNTSADPTSATAIHHPNGDEKSISFEYDPATTTSYFGASSPGNGTHIRIADWDVGTTEPGSSGSPLFDQNKHVVGQLHGGEAACGNDLPDWYGRLSVSWPQIASYLDPLGTGTTTLDTYAPWLGGIQVSGTALNSTGNAGGPFSPTSTIYTVTNADLVPRDYTVGADVNWLDVSSASGTLAAGASVAITVSLNAIANTLGNGLYYGAVNFTNVTTGEGDTSKTVRLEVGVPELVYSYPLDTDPGWTRDGDWGFGVPQGAGGDAHGFADPATGYTGANVLGYNLAGDYPDNLPETHLVTTAINCSDITATTLRFWRWLNVEVSTYDHASIAVSNDNSTFTTIWANSAEITDNAWVQQTYDISAVADGQATVYIRWTMGSTDTSWQYSGWNLDDIEIWGLTDPALSAITDLPGHRLSVGNHPNPFNPLTKISYVLEREGPASVRVYDVQGRLIRTLVDERRPAGAGSVVWDGTDRDGQRAASGIYFVQVASGGQRADHKMVLLK